MKKNKIAECNVRELFPRHLRKARERKLLTQTALAYICDLPVSLINHYEQARRLPSIPNLILLASYLDVSTDFLLGRTVLWRP